MPLAHKAGQLGAQGGKAATQYRTFMRKCAASHRIFGNTIPGRSVIPESSVLQMTMWQAMVILLALVLLTEVCWSPFTNEVKSNVLT